MAQAAGASTDEESGNVSSASATSTRSGDDSDHSLGRQALGVGAVEGIAKSARGPQVISPRLEQVLRAETLDIEELRAAFGGRGVARDDTDGDDDTVGTDGETPTRSPAMDDDATDATDSPTAADLATDHWAREEAIGKDAPWHSRDVRYLRVRLKEAHRVIALLRDSYRNMFDGAVSSAEADRLEEIYSGRLRSLEALVERQRDTIVERDAEVARLRTRVVETVQEPDMPEEFAAEGLFESPFSARGAVSTSARRGRHRRGVTNWDSSSASEDDATNGAKVGPHRSCVDRASSPVAELAALATAFRVPTRNAKCQATTVSSIASRRQSLGDADPQRVAAAPAAEDDDESATVAHMDTNRAALLEAPDRHTSLSKTVAVVAAVLSADAATETDPAVTTQPPLRQTTSDQLTAPSNATAAAASIGCRNVGIQCNRHAAFKAAVGALDAARGATVGTQTTATVGSALSHTRNANAAVFEDRHAVSRGTSPLLAPDVSLSDWHVETSPIRPRSDAADVTTASPRRVVGAGEDESTGSVMTVTRIAAGLRVVRHASLSTPAPPRTRVDSSRDGPIGAMIVRSAPRVIEQARVDAASRAALVAAHSDRHRLAVINDQLQRRCAGLEARLAEVSLVVTTAAPRTMTSAVTAVPNEEARKLHEVASQTTDAVPRSFASIASGLSTPADGRCRAVATEAVSPSQSNAATSTVAPVTRNVAIGVAPPAVIVVVAGVQAEEAPMTPPLVAGTPILPPPPSPLIVASSAPAALDRSTDIVPRVAPTPYPQNRSMLLVSRTPPPPPRLPTTSASADESGVMSPAAPLANTSFHEPSPRPPAMPIPIRTVQDSDTRGHSVSAILASSDEDGDGLLDHDLRSDLQPPATHGSHVTLAEKMSFANLRRIVDTATVATDTADLASLKEQPAVGSDVAAALPAATAVDKSQRYRQLWHRSRRLFEDALECARDENHNLRTRIALLQRTTPALVSTPSAARGEIGARGRGAHRDPAE